MEDFMSIKKALILKKKFILKKPRFPWRKVVSIFLSCAIILTILNGCTKGIGKENAISKYSKGDKTTIEWLAYQTTAEPNPDSKVIKRVEEKFNVNFKFWYVSEKDWEENLKLKLAAGMMPDVLRIRSTNEIPTLVKRGIIGELPIERIAAFAPNYMNTVQKYDTDKIMWDYTNYEGKNYGFTGITLDGIYPPVMVWRTDWLKNVGISKVPETLLEFEEAIYKFRNDDPDRNAKRDTFGISNKSFDAVFGAFGVPISDIREHNVMVKEGNVVFSAIQPEAKQALSVLQKWYKEGLIDPEFLTGENTGGYIHLSQAFINGRIGVTKGFYYHFNPPLGRTDKGGQNYVELKKINPTASIELGRPPIGPNGKSGTVQSGYAREPIALTTKCLGSQEKTETVLKMLDELFSNEEYAKLVRYGIEGEDFKMVDGEIVGISEENNSRVKGIQIFNFLNVPPDLLKKYKKTRYDYADKTSKYPGYIRPVVPPTDEAAKYNINLVKMTEEAYINIITGKKSIDYFDEFVKNFLKNGGNEAEKSMNEAYKKMKLK